ncbi:MAG: hypothetical protein WC375_02785 [Methanomassiliicoccales archaeon]|jgi:hypothetical protein
MTTIVEAAKWMMGKRCTHLVKQSKNEITFSGEIGAGMYSIDVKNLSNKIKEIYQVPPVMVALDSAQYLLCCYMYELDKQDPLKDLCKKIRLQVILAFGQLQVIISMPSDDNLKKEILEWIKYMNILMKNIIEMINPEVGIKKQPITNGVSGFQSSDLKSQLDKSESFKNLNSYIIKYKIPTTSTRPVSLEKAKEIAKKKGLKPGRVKGTEGLQFTKGSNNRIEVIPWDQFGESLNKRGLTIYESGGWMKIMRIDSHLKPIMKYQKITNEDIKGALEMLDGK